MLVLIRNTARMMLIVAVVLITASPAFAGNSSASSPSSKTGGWRLGLESSPYLRMHADNPVEWYPWGEEAFARARSENKPLFISIGYFTCHWCHVMARESFSNPEIAKILNDHFVSIKIDREQRPDLDAAYMDFVQLTTGRGGWPMSVWATPDGDPFLGGTYFPPQAKYGRLGMKELLPRIHKRWVEGQTELLALARGAVRQLQSTESTGKPLAHFSRDMLVEAQRQFRLRYDEFQGGFGSAPKFPQPGRLLYLLLDTGHDGEDMALATLDHMAAGGIYDHLAGGFHRYATDPEWKVPHFEKMLYDQALIVRPYLAAYRKTGDINYARVVREVLDFCLQQMRDPQAGFYSALSADSPLDKRRHSEMQEGAFYVWSEDQWQAALQDEPSRAIGAAWYGVKPYGNVQSGEVAGSNILYREKTIQEMAQQFGISEAAVGHKIASINRRLLKARRGRPAVPVDDKVVTAWNGYMITSLVQASELLKEPAYLRAAEQTATFVLGELYDKDQKVLYRDWRRGVRGVPGFAEDYGAMAEGLLELHRSTGKKKWLDAARELTDLQIEKFWDESSGGFFGTTSQTKLWVRNKDATDGVTPSPNAVAIHNLLMLGKLANNRDYTQRALRTGRWVGGVLQEIPSAMPYTLIEWSALMAAADTSSKEAPADAR